MTHYRKSFEVTGYTTEDGSVLCVDCMDELDELIKAAHSFPPIFLDSEWDYPPTCDHCFEAIDCSVIVLPGAGYGNDLSV